MVLAANPWINQQKKIAQMCGCALRCVRMDGKHWKGFIDYQVHEAQAEGVGRTLQCVTLRPLASLHVRVVLMTRMVEVTA